MRRNEPVWQFATSTEGKVFSWPFILGHECSSEPRAHSDCLYQSWHLLDLVASLILLAKMTEVLWKEEKNLDLLHWVGKSDKQMKAFGECSEGWIMRCKDEGNVTLPFGGALAEGVGLQAMEGHSPVSYCKCWDWRHTGIQPLPRWGVHSSWECVSDYLLYTNILNSLSNFFE